MSKDTHQADARRFLDERGTAGPAAPNGLNPATIMEKAVRERIVDSYFWKEQCFGVNEADVVDRVADHVRFVAGTTGTAQRPSPFLCLAFKLLQLAPSDAVLAEYLGYGGERFKYLRALAAFYVRLTRRAEDVYKLLEPLLEDRRKLRRRGRAGAALTFVDEFVDDLLVKERVCGTSLWKMPAREQLEDLELLEPRVSPLGDIEDLLDEEEEGEGGSDEEEEQRVKSSRDSDDDGYEERERDRDDDDREDDEMSENDYGSESGEERENRRSNRKRASSSRDDSREAGPEDSDRMDVDRDRRRDSEESR